MKKIILILVVLLVGMEAVGWWTYKKFTKPDAPFVENPVSQVQATSPSDLKPSASSSSDPTVNNGSVSSADKIDASSQQALLGANVGKFPYVVVEKQGELTMRTIHIGVRQWAWDPMTLEANYGEKVNLIIHNADVAHSISIPELGVKTDIPEEGAIVTFMASKRGTFEYSCETPCGKGHSQMRGKITIK